MRRQIVVNPRKGRCVPCPVTPEGCVRRCHLSVYLSRLLGCSGICGAAARRHHGKWRHDSAPMNQNSTAAHRPAAPLTAAHLIQPTLASRLSDRDFTTLRLSHPRDENPASQSPPDGKHPGTAWQQSVTPLIKRRPVDVAHSGTCKSPRQTSHHGKSLCTCGHADRPHFQRGRPPGVTVDQRESHPAFLRSVLRRHPEILLRLTGDIHAGNLSPSGVLTKPHDSLAHIAGRAPESLILSLSWDYCESLLMERKPPKLPTLLQKLSHSGIYCIYLS